MAYFSSRKSDVELERTNPDPHLGVHLCYIRKIKSFCINILINDVIDNKEVLDMLSKQRAIVLAHVLSTLNIMIFSVLTEVDIITSVPYAVKVFEERNQKTLALPSGQRCRNCASDTFYLKETLEMINVSPKPVLCEKYECDKCGKEVEYCKYST